MKKIVDFERSPFGIICVLLNKDIKQLRELKNGPFYLDKDGISYLKEEVQICLNIYRELEQIVQKN